LGDNVAEFRCAEACSNENYSKRKPPKATLKEDHTQAIEEQQAMDTHSFTLVVVPQRLSIRVGIAPWIVSLATLFIGGCHGNSSLYDSPDYTSVPHTSVEANQKLETVRPSKPRPIGEWTDPSDRELAQHLLAIDEQRRILGSLLSDLWRTKPSTTNRDGFEAPSIFPADSANTITSPSKPVSSSNAELVFQLHKKLKNLIWYPPIAARSGWEGEVIIDVVLRETGEFIVARVHKSSGHPILDHSAVETVRQACPLTLKEPLEHPVIKLRVPIKYNIGRR
jgi:TonB family protein